MDMSFQSDQTNLNLRFKFDGKPLLRIVIFYKTNTKALIKGTREKLADERSDVCVAHHTKIKESSVYEFR